MSSFPSIGPSFPPSLSSPPPLFSPSSPTNFLIWQVGPSVDQVIVRPETVTQLVHTIYSTYPQTIRPVTVEGYQVIDILGGTEACPATFNPQSLVKVDRITHEFTPEQVDLLRTLVKNIINQSAKSDLGSLNSYLLSSGYPLSSVTAMINEEVDRVVTPPVVDLLLTTTQPQSLMISYNSGTIKEDLCKVSAQLPIIIFSASLLERVTRSVLLNERLRPLFLGMNRFQAQYQDPLAAPSRNVPATNTGAWFWIMLILLIILIIVVIYIVR